MIVEKPSCLPLHRCTAEIHVNKTCSMQLQIRLKTIALSLSLYLFLFPSVCVICAESFWQKHCWNFFNGISENLSSAFVGGGTKSQRVYSYCWRFLTMKLVPINDCKPCWRFWLSEAAALQIQLKMFTLSLWWIQGFFFFRSPVYSVCRAVAHQLFVNINKWSFWRGKRKSATAHKRFHSLSLGMQD